MLEGYPHISLCSVGTRIIFVWRHESKGRVITSCIYTRMHTLPLFGTCTSYSFMSVLYLVKAWSPYYNVLNAENVAEVSLIGYWEPITAYTLCNLKITRTFHKTAADVTFDPFPSGMG